MSEESSSPDYLRKKSSKRSLQIFSRVEGVGYVVQKIDSPPQQNSPRCSRIKTPSEVLRNDQQIMEDRLNNLQNIGVDEKPEEVTYSKIVFKIQSLRDLQSLFCTCQMWNRWYSNQSLWEHMAYVIFDARALQLKRELPNGSHSERSWHQVVLDETKKLQMINRS